MLFEMEKKYTSYILPTFPNEYLTPSRMEKIMWALQNGENYVGYIHIDALQTGEKVYMLHTWPLQNGEKYYRLYT